ncbi:flagellar basal body-associated FliL family protein [Henriciella litoralis]|uniref:flagellar basal body-associated FliL family protein n=1 Tax=Henriciella litoralis TaxID=568102 RepID=UPI000A076E42|nr:flagellar basal body-associated FliL family protein [Henriciella litoralis]
MAKETDTSNDQAEKKPGGSLVNWAILAVVSAACSFAVVFFLFPSANTESAACPAPEQVASTKVEPLAREELSYVQLDELLVTIGNEPATRFVKLNTSIVTEKGNEKKITEAQPMLSDAFISYLRSVELSDFETAGFYPRMREQLGRRAELVLGSDTSQGVLITEFLLR